MEKLELEFREELRRESLPPRHPMLEWLHPKRLSWQERIVRQWSDPNVRASVVQQFCMNRHFVIAVAFRLWLFREFSSVTIEKINQG